MLHHPACAAMLLIKRSCSGYNVRHTLLPWSILKASVGKRSELGRVLRTILGVDFTMLLGKHADVAHASNKNIHALNVAYSQFESPCDLQLAVNVINRAFCERRVQLCSIYAHQLHQQTPHS